MGSHFGQLSKCTVADNVPKQVLPFYFVKIFPKYADLNWTRTIQEAVTLFEENDQLLLQISEQIRDKVFDRERMLSRLQHLKNYYHNGHNLSTSRKLNTLAQLNRALDKFSFATSTTEQEELDNKKLNFRMKHVCRNLAEEKKLLRNMNMCHKTHVASSSSSPLSELLTNIQRKYDHSKKHCEQNNCDRLLKEIKHFEVTRKKSTKLKQSIKKQVKITSDELMEMRKKKRALETNIKVCDKEIEDINEEIWCFQEHLKEKNKRKDACLCVLDETQVVKYWVLKISNLEYQSIHYHSIYLDK